jgi:hypothetical protein
VSPSIIPKLTVNIPMPSGAKQPLRTHFSSEFAFRDRVLIDGDQSIIGVVSGFAWSTEEGYTVKVSWMHAGAAQVAWFDSWRLELADNGEP